MNHAFTLSANLAFLRTSRAFSQENVAEKIGVSRQAIAKWENGDTLPDLLNCEALAKLYDVSLDDLIHHDATNDGIPIGPKGKHVFGAVMVDEQGRVPLPAEAREVLDIHPGQSLIVLGDENPESFGIALVPRSRLLQLSDMVKDIDEGAENDA